MKALATEDRFAIQDLIASYSWALDTGDVEALVSCFHDDAIMTEEVFDEPDIWEGHDGIRGIAEHYRNAPGFPGRQHHVTQTQFTSNKDGVISMRSFAFVTECHDEPPYLLRFTGWYDDIVSQDAQGKWLFKKRTVRLWDGEVLQNFPGKGEWTPRKRPDSLIIKK